MIHQHPEILERFANQFIQANKKNKTIYFPYFYKSDLWILLISVVALNPGSMPSYVQAWGELPSRHAGIQSQGFCAARRRR